MKYAALLRGINVGGHRKLPMAELRAILEELGAVEVASYIQSGNVVYAADAKLAKAMPAKLQARIQADYGYEVPVVQRSEKALRAILAACPFPADDKRLNVGFLEKRPTAAQLKALDPARSPGDEVKVVGQEIFVLYRVGQSKTKLTHDYLERTLGQSTMRNWRTVNKLLQMCAE